MIDTQQQYIKLNIRFEISIIVVQAHSGRKRDICTYMYIHLLTYIFDNNTGIHNMLKYKHNTFKRKIKVYTKAFYKN